VALQPRQRVSVPLVTDDCKAVVPVVITIVLLDAPIAEVGDQFVFSDQEVATLATCLSVYPLNQS
jgi:hypothetical protein